jgi:DNA-binding SARP family transcriptional activator
MFALARLVVAMNPLRVNLFGPVEVHEGEMRLAPFATRHAKGLFAYLVLNRGRAHTREKLAGTFWAEKAEQAARRCLRTTIWRVRAVLEPKGVVPGTYLKAHDHAMEFTGGAGFWLDVSEFEDCLHRANGSTGERFDGESLRLLEQAVALYRGDLLEGIYDDWCLCEQQRLRLLLIGALESLIGKHASREAWAEALTWSRRLLEQDPLREHAHRDLMRFHFLTGDRPAALRQFDKLVELLEASFGISPTPETLALNDALRAGRLPTPA